MICCAAQDDRIRPTSNRRVTKGFPTGKVEYAPKVDSQQMLSFYVSQHA